MRVPITRSSWSVSSQRTGGHYDDDATEYEALRCQCRGCGISFIFTAEQQQISYEVEKKYVWWLPPYCDACTVRLADLNSRNRSYLTHWDTDRQRLKGDKAFLSNWLDVLREMSGLGKGNPSMETHLTRLLNL